MSDTPRAGPPPLLDVSIPARSNIEDAKNLTDEIATDSGTNTMGAAFKLDCRPFSVTLDGPAICGLSVILILLIHFVEPPYAEIVIVLAPAFLIIQHDYNNFVGLGPGGTPSTITGYLRIAWYRLWALNNPYAADTSHRSCHPAHGILAHDSLPYRAGPRPTVAGIAPQRQLDQRGGARAHLILRQTLQALALAKPERFGTARSCLEKHGLGLFARRPLNVVCNGEVMHVHDSDRSMHMCLHPEDAAEVLAKGWGQRHPLARKGWWFMRMPVPEDFVMAYAPRDEHDLRVLIRILSAAIWYTTGELEQIDAAETAVTSSP